MIRIGRYFIVKALYILIDVAFLSLSLYAVCWLRESTLPFTVTPKNLFFESSNSFRYAFSFWILVTVFVSNAYGLYQTKREIFETVEIWKVMKAVILSSLIMIVAMFTVKISNFPRSIIFMQTTLAFVSLSLWRVLKRVFVEYLVTQGYNNFNVLIVGAGKIGSALMYEIQKNPALGLNIVGYLDDSKTSDSSSKGVKVLGKISDFSRIARREFVNKVFITCHHDGEAFLKTVRTGERTWNSCSCCSSRIRAYVWRVFKI